jgi:small membrane protein
MDDQIVIKIILLVLFAALALLVIWPGRGARRLALRRVGMLLFFVLAAFLVLFPGLSDSLARLVGVGRGADLLLYGLFIAFVVYVVTTRAHHSRVDLQLTELARAQALASAPDPRPEER